jgi:hypothetical protein
MEFSLEKQEDCFFGQSLGNILSFSRSGSVGKKVACVHLEHVIIAEMKTVIMSYVSRRSVKCILYHDQMNS